VFKGGSVLMGPCASESLASLRAIGPCLAFLDDATCQWLIPLTQQVKSISSSSSSYSSSTVYPWREYIAQSRCIIASLPLHHFLSLVKSALETVRGGLLRKMAASTLHVAAEVMRHKSRDRAIQQGGGQATGMQSLIFGEGRRS
jgi:hypothetical protein